MEIEKIFKEKFSMIIEELKNQGINLTTIAKSMGYTSTSQLHHATSDNGLPSTKAILLMIEKYRINPTFLFTGKDEIFLSDESEIEILRKENRELSQKHNEAVKTVVQLSETIKELEKQHKDLIEITSDALKYHKRNNKTQE